MIALGCWWLWWLLGEWFTGRPLHLNTSTSCPNVHVSCPLWSCYKVWKGHIVLRVLIRMENDWESSWWIYLPIPKKVVFIFHLVFVLLPNRKSYKWTRKVMFNCVHSYCSAPTAICRPSSRFFRRWWSCSRSIYPKSIEAVVVLIYIDN